MHEPIEKIMLKCETIRSKQSIKELLKILSTNRSNFIVVVDEEGKAEGIATENNLLKLLKVEPIPGVQAVINDDVGKSIFNGSVSSIMTKDPIKVKKSATTHDALNIMISQDSRYVLIVDDDDMPLGYVRLSDVMKKLVGE